MFTGIVEEVGIVKGTKKGANSISIEITANEVISDSKVGDSIAVNGVCLTATTISNNSFTADVMPETLRRSSLNNVTIGSKVNLERAMAANGRFGGHIVSGHIDGVGTISSINKEDNVVWFTINAESKILKLIIEKGSIAIDGISLTVASVDNISFKVSIIPHTAKETTLLSKKINDIVNLENDIIGKYVEKLILNKETEKVNGDSNLDMTFLAKHGFC